MLYASNHLTYAKLGAWQLNGMGLSLWIQNMPFHFRQKIKIEKIT
jgi:hypothetical protein